MVASWALLNCYSRMYMGVHYPGDILCGALAGMLIGYLCYRLYMWAVTRKWQLPTKPSIHLQPIDKTAVLVIAFVYAFTWLGILLNATWCVL